MEMDNKPKRIKWSSQEENAFVELWEEKLPELRGSRKNTHIYAEMSQELQTYGIRITPQEVRSKINNLILKYKKAKAALGSGSSPPDWELWPKVHIILGPSKAINFPSLVYESTQDAPTNEMEVEWLEEESEASTSFSPFAASSPTNTGACSTLPSPALDASGSSARVREPAALKNKGNAAVKDVLLQLNANQKKMNHELQNMCANDEKLIALATRKVAALEKQVADDVKFKESMLKTFEQLSEYLKKL